MCRSEKCRVKEDTGLLRAPVPRGCLIQARFWLEWGCSASHPERSASLRGARVVPQVPRGCPIQARFWLEWGCSLRESSRAQRFSSRSEGSGESLSMTPDYFGAPVPRGCPIQARFWLEWGCSLQESSRAQRFSSRSEGGAPGSASAARANLGSSPLEETANSRESSRAQRFSSRSEGSGESLPIPGVPNSASGYAS